MSGRVISGQPLLGAGDILLQSIGSVIIGGTSVFGGQGGVLRTVLGVLVIAFMVNGLTFSPSTLSRSRSSSEPSSSCRCG